MAVEFDVTVIGGGPGGYVCALRAAQLGLKVAIVEKDASMGGTCLLRGCIPTKAMLHDAEVWSQVKKGGLVKGDLDYDWKAVLKHKDKAIQVNSKGVAFLLKRAEVQTFHGLGSIPTPGRVVVTADDGSTTELASKSIVIATGSAPRLIPGLEVDEKKIVTSDGCLELEAVPKRFVVIGSGAVGVEFASVFARFGSEVTIVEMLPRIVPIEDEEVSAELARYFKKQGMKILTGTTVKKAEVSGDAVRIETEGEGGSESLEADVLLVAVGRRPVTDGLGLDAIGVEMDRGFVLVDAHQRTNVAGIYAIGDVAPGPQLAHKASAEGIVAAETIAAAETVPIEHRLVPGATYCEPEIGSIGLTEAAAREHGHDVKVGKFPFTANGRARIEQLGVGFVKIVSDARYGEILGVHIIGPHATELIAAASSVLRLEGTVEELARTIHAHPTVSEAIGEAAHANLGHAIHA